MSLNTRQKLDEYLDGDQAMGPASPDEARLLSVMKSERALRAAAYASYMPSAEESRNMAASFMAAAYDTPVGRVGPWSYARKLVGVAAAIALLAGTFAVGRLTATPASTGGTIATSSPVKTWVVVHTDIDGVVSVSHELPSEADMQAYVQTLPQTGNTRIVQADQLAQFVSPGSL